jgi:hypothetical protein
MAALKSLNLTCSDKVTGEIESVFVNWKKRIDWKVNEVL